MTMGQVMRSHSHHRRFYIFLTTVVIGAILILTMMNDNGGNFDFLTGSSVGLEERETGEEREVLEEISRGEEIGVRLNFDTVPEAKEKTRLKSVRITFDDLSTKIKINEEELELKGLKEVEMEINDFNGELDFDEMSISLKGAGEKVVVNGIVISGKGRMDISFGDLIYESLVLKEVGLNLLDFDEGSGELMVGEKLNYKLNNEELELRGFEGDLSVGTNNENESLLLMEGRISGVSVEGDFDLTLG